MSDKLIVDITDHELITELKMGVPKFFELLFDKYSPLVLSILKVLKVEEQRSELILVSSFMRMKNEIHSFDPSKTRLFTWVIKISQETIHELCSKEIEQFKIQNIDNYVNSSSISKSPLLDLLMTKTFSFDEVIQLIGITREELLLLIKAEVTKIEK